MAPIIPTKISPFRTKAAFTAWMKKHRVSASEIWMRIYKKDSGVATITNAEALDVALCFGSIDAIRTAAVDPSWQCPHADSVDVEAEMLAKLRAHPWKRPELAETTRSQGELIVRYEADDTIAVTTRVALGDVSASGFVFLRRSTLDTAAQSDHLRLARARAWQTLAAMFVVDQASSLAAVR